MQHRPLRAGGAASRRSRPLARGPRRAPPAPPRAPRASVLAAAPPLLGPGGLALRLLQLPSTPEHLLGVRLAGVALSAATAWVLLAAASRAAPPRWGADADAAEAELEAWLQLHGLHDEHATPAAEAATAALATLSPTAATGLHSRFLRPLRFAILAAAAVAAGASAASYFHAPPLVFLALRRALACAAFGVSSWLLVALQQLALARAARAHPPDAPSLAGLKEALRAATAGVGLLAAAQAAGAPAAPLLALGSVGGLSFGLATQVTASNLVSGAAILLSRHLRVGDKVGLPGTGEKGFVTAFSLDSTTVTLEDTTTVFVPNGEFAKSVVRNITRRTHWPLKAVLRVPFASLPLCERLCADMEAYCRGRPDFAEAPPRLNCRVVLGELEHFAVPIEVTTFCRSEGVTQAEMERRRSDVVFRCCELAVRAGVPLVAPVMEVGLHPDVAVARGMLPYKRVVEDGSYVDDK